MAPPEIFASEKAESHEVRRGISHSQDALTRANWNPANLNRMTDASSAVFYPVKVDEHGVSEDPSWDYDVDF